MSVRPDILVGHLYTINFKVFVWHVNWDPVLNIRSASGSKPFITLLKSKYQIVVP
jgi:hypothetical protein